MAPPHSLPSDRRAMRWSPDLRPCSSSGRTSLVAAKRAAAGRISLVGAKRAAASRALGADDLEFCSSSGRSSLGAKRAEASKAARIPRRKKQPRAKAKLNDSDSSVQTSSLKRKPERGSILGVDDLELAPRRPKRPRTTFDDPVAGSSTLARSLKRKPVDSILVVADLQFCSSAQFPIWGAKRPRTSILGADDLQFCSLAQLPIWGAKRLRSALGGSPLNRRDWTNLGEGPAGLIAERLLANDVADYIRFRAVCRPWRLCSTDPRAHGVLDSRFHPRQWVMIRETVTTSQHRRFLNVSTGYCICIHLPELHGHNVFGPTTEGLLVLVHRTTFLVRVLNPLTLQSADLPPATTLLNQIVPQDICDTENFKVSGAGLADSSTFVINFIMISTVAAAKPGDEHWTVLDHGSCIFPALSFAGHFYCFTTRAIMVVKTSMDQPPQLVVAAKLVRKFSWMMDSVHLVDNDGELMLVYRKCSGNGNWKYDVYRVDLDARKTMPVRGLGGRTLFIGIERALSVLPSVFHTIRADAIYLGFDGQFTGRMDRTLCHLMDGTAELRDVYNSINGMPLYGPWGADHYLSCCVTGYGEEVEDT